MRGKTSEMKISNLDFDKYHYGDVLGRFSNNPGIFDIVLIINDKSVFYSLYDYF